MPQHLGQWNLSRGVGCLGEPPGRGLCRRCGTEGLWAGLSNPVGTRTITCRVHRPQVCELPSAQVKRHGWKVVICDLEHPSKDVRCFCSGESAKALAYGQDLGCREVDSAAVFTGVERTRGRRQEDCPEIQFPPSLVSLS